MQNLPRVPAGTITQSEVGLITDTDLVVPAGTVISAVCPPSNVTAKIISPGPALNTEKVP